jgi:putative membrane protein
MKRLFSLFIAAALVAACDNDDNDVRGLSQAERNFVLVASETSKAKVEFGQLAAERGSSAEIKAYGSRMVTDYSAAITELESLANAKGAVMIKDLNPDHSRMRDSLMHLSANSFDAVYIESQVKEDEALANLFRAQHANGQDVDFRNYAGKYLLIANEHLTSSQELKAAIAPTDTPAGRTGG